MSTKEEILVEIEPLQDMLVSAFKAGIAITKSVPLEIRGTYDCSTLAQITHRHIWAKIKEMHEPSTVTVEFNNGLSILRTPSGLVIRVKKNNSTSGMPVGQPTKQSRDYYGQEDIFGAKEYLVLCYDPDDAFENLVQVEIVRTSSVQPKGGRPVSDWSAIIFNSITDTNQINLALPETDIPLVQKRITAKAKKKSDAG